MALSGAFTEQSDLIALRFQARLQLSSHKRSLRALAGPYRASFRGRGMDFEEVRAYQAGDDVRAIDWRVTARTGEPYTKLFREERERPVFVLVDQRASMFFGSQQCFKSVLAAETAALLAWSALRQNDRVGGLVMGQQELKEIRPKRSKSAVLQWLHSVHEHNLALSALRATPDDYSFAEVLMETRRLLRPGSAVFVVSDFHDFDEHSKRHLFQLSQHNEVTAFHVFDEMEQQLPPPGQYLVTDGRQRGRLNSRQKKLREQYQAAAAMRLQRLREAMISCGAPLVPLRTGCEPLRELMRYYNFQRGR